MFRITRKMVILVSVAVLVTAIFFVLRHAAPSAVGVDPRFDEELEHGTSPSMDLIRDKKLMWVLVPHETIDQSGKVTYMVSPVSAINAASRVIEAESGQLIGRSKKETLDYLNHDPNHRKGAYNFPFFPLAATERAMVLRFDCGNFGWQFDLLLDENDKVVKVRRHWIH